MSARPRRPGVYRRGLAVTGALLLIGVSVFCARSGVADLALVDATARQMALQERLPRSGGFADAQEVKAIGDALTRAQNLEPGNPSTAEQLGGLYSLNVREAAGEGAKGGIIGTKRTQALEQYAMAVAMRPTSPYAWASLAWTKYYLGQADPAFYRALDNAMRLGPWEPEVQFVVVDLGFALWDELSAELRPRVLAMAQNAQQRYAAQIGAIAKKRGRLAEVCTFEKLATMALCKPIAG